MGKSNVGFLLGVALLGAAAIFLSCAHRTVPPLSGKITYREEGIASWYGSKFHGRKTSSGERYNMHGVSAAHRTLPLGTIVRVTHVKSGRQIVVRINDRGPFVEGRIIDLSYGAARRLGMVNEGVAPVVVEAFASLPGVPALAAVPGPFAFSIQVGSFLVRENAEKLRDLLGGRFGEVTITTFEDNSGTYHRVRIGSFATEEAALRTASDLRREGHSCFIVREG